MKMKTIIRQNTEGELLVNTLPHDSDTGILHRIFYPELQINDNMIVGFGFTDIPEELKGFPVIVIEGNGDTEQYILDAIFKIIGRMNDVIAALVYYTDLDYDAYKEEIDLYHSLFQLMLKYCKTYYNETVFANMGDCDENSNDFFRYKLLWRANDNGTDIFKLPKEKSSVYPEAIKIARNIPVLNVDDIFRLSYGATPSLEEPGSIFFMIMEFNKPIITIPDIIWALNRIISYALGYIPKLIGHSQEARLYASMIFSILSKNVKMILSGDCEQ